MRWVDHWDFYETWDAFKIHIKKQFPVLRQTAILLDPRSRYFLFQTMKTKKASSTNNLTLHFRFDGKLFIYFSKNTGNTIASEGTPVCIFSESYVYRLWVLLWTRRVKMIWLIKSIWYVLKYFMDLQRMTKVNTDKKYEKWFQATHKYKN